MARENVAGGPWKKGRCLLAGPHVVVGYRTPRLAAANAMQPDDDTAM